jgi:hypothetical protein
MSVGRYRITSPTIGVFQEKGRDVAGLVPEGAIIYFSEEASVGEKLIDVVWDGQTVRMFPRDLRSRAVPEVDQSKGNAAG